MMHEVDILRAAIDVYGEEAQTKMVLEEMSELQKEICKRWRGADNIGNIAEELADVEIMLDQLKMMLDIEVEVGQYRHEKLLRLQNRLYKTPGAEVGAQGPDGKWWYRTPNQNEGGQHE